jgi:hypothetical protein
MDNVPPSQQQILDNEHLRLLSIFHYVNGGILAFFACIPMIHVVLGLVMIFAPHLFGHGKDQPPAFDPPAEVGAWDSGVFVALAPGTCDYHD